MSPAVDYSRIADLYDRFVLFEADLPFFVEECRSAEGRVLELMSGTGRVSVALLEAGVRLTCVDCSAEMLDQLRRKLAARGLSAEIVEQDVRSLDFDETFELALLPFNSFQELADRASQRAALASIHSVLTPGGRFVCTLHNPPVHLERVGKGPTTVVRSERPDGELTVVVDLTHDPRSGQIHGTETFVKRDPEGRVLLQRDLELRYALIGEQDFRQLAQEAGFVVRSMYGDFERSPFCENTSPFMIWTLQKAAETA